MTTRRDFLQQSSAAGIGFWALGGVQSLQGQGANDKLNIASIGVGGKGSSDCDQAANFGNMIAICDIDGKRLDKKGQKFPQAKKYFDFRKMFEELGDKIDAVTVSTPDHTHAVASMMAINKGKHVYCQKPLTHTVKEARVMRETAKKKGVCTQMGNQGTASTGLREGVDVIRAGVIGPVREVHVWTNRPVWPQSPGVKSRPKDKPPVPDYIHWDEFLGPAPFRAYHPAYHPFKWRGWWDFGTGALGDMACHTANLPFLALKLGYPSSVKGECEPINPETYPSWARIEFEFPARGDMPPVKLIWYEGRKDGKLVHPPEELQAKFLKDGEKLRNSGSIMVGADGIMYSPSDYGGSWRVTVKEYKKPKPTLPRNGGGDNGMKREWVEAIKANKPAIALSNFDYAALLTETILLGNVAMHAPGKRLEWDGPNLKFTNYPEANQFLHMDYRKGWTL